MIKYRTRRNFYGDNLIEPIEIELCVWRGDRRELKRTHWRIYHDTWEDAKAYLLDLAKRNLQSAENDLSYAQDIYKKVIELRN